MIFQNSPVATVAINLRPRAGSWGGANQWAAQVVRCFEYHHWKVRFDLRQVPDIVLMTHTGLSLHTTFGADDVARMKEKAPGVPCLHRINDNDIRKETSEMDAALACANRVADHTVFVSSWLRDHHAAKWFDPARRHSVIVPGADPRFFHPVGGRKRKPGEPCRLVTHHWSDNWNKGFDVYRDIDALAAGPLKGTVDLRVIGRWPKEIVWQSARTFAPTSGGRLAGLLRDCDAYVSASRFEPGAMHVAEGLQCGLPLLYHKDSGGTVGQGLLYGMEIGDDLEATLREFAGRLPGLRKRLLASPPSGAAMANSYLQLAQSLIVDA
ncbi:MAG: hypothetical protein WCS31_01455 [Verrucomicrobiae bacterium]